MKKGTLIEGIEIVDLGAKGKVIGKKDGQAFLTKGVIPGDIVSILVRKNKKGMKEGVAKRIEKPSADRVEARCAHQKYCGGCSWQELDYAKQIEYKERNVLQQLRRIGGLTEFTAEPIMGAEKIYGYRNKMEFTFIQERWLTPEEISTGDVIPKDQGLGFHVPGRFDWVLHIDECHLQESEHNAMRNFLFTEAQKLELSFYHPRLKEGILRNAVLRNNRKGEWMVLMIVKEQTAEVDSLYKKMLEQFPNILSLWSIINTKVNDTFTDCPATLIHGDANLTETFTRPDGGTLDYLIGPKSFFQTNSHQAERLYSLIHDWAGLSGDELVYDLYTGTGSIALYLANKARKVVGIEYVPEAIADAEENARINEVTNCDFYAGDMREILTEIFVAEHGTPDVLITDPPRAGMHGDVVQCILSVSPKRIVYVSCDPATQARDLALLKVKYDVIKTRAVDMFPHTSHVENVALLTLRGE
ncbi:MAG: 23S rRNA (uracil(1939)-C(5))-methyltransferase RlmD [Flavobacteriales bacterium]|nr:23S rRNA (uracil(1939)-C(5))-methyltransferase RlmD [Flavobacteriales bacterium]